MPPAGIRLAQVLHHGTDHRSQICTALTTLGHEPPEIDVWEYGEVVGLGSRVPPPEPACVAAGAWRRRRCRSS